jgi:hypothetical protein
MEIQSVDLMVLSKAALKVSLTAVMLVKRTVEYLVEKRDRLKVVTMADTMVLMKEKR